MSDGFVPLLAKVCDIQKAESNGKWYYGCYVFEDGEIEWVDEQHISHPHGMYHDPKYGSTGSDKRRKPLNR